MRRILLAVALSAAAFVVPAMPVAAQTTCNGLPVSMGLGGTPGNDTIRGTNGPDVIAGEGGNDTLLGLGDDDTICGGPGDDMLVGGRGDDTVVAEPGVDGSDEFVGGPDVDTTSYSARATEVDVSLNDDVANDGTPGVLGAPGEGDNNRSDVENIIGSRGVTPLANGINDLRGNGSRNTITGLNGNDRIVGFAGNDRLLGGGGNNDFIPGIGDDTILGRQADGDDIVEASAGRDGADFFQGGPGDDTVTYAARTDGVTVSLDNLANDGELGEGDNANDRVENITGSTANDVLIARSFLLNSTLDGNLGVDRCIFETPGRPDEESDDTALSCERF